MVYVRHMILSGHEIRKQLELGRITIDPTPVAINDESRDQFGRINPASVDLTLGTEVAVYEDFTFCQVADEWSRLKEAGLGGLHHRQQGFGVGPYDGRGLNTNANASSGSMGDQALDVKKPANLRKWQMDPEVGWLLQPGVGYLMHTNELVHTDHYVPVLDGKSSIGRLFIQVHVTAGYGDPGFHGQYTLEVISLFPVRVYPGMRFCQMRFHRIEGEVLNYQDTGHYKGERATGAVGSRIYETGF